MMSNKQRKSIVRAAKRKTDWYDGETSQDLLIEAECKKRGYELHHFYAEDGQILEKLLR